MRPARRPSRASAAPLALVAGASPPIPPATRPAAVCRASARRQPGQRRRVEALICAVEGVLLHYDPDVEVRIERDHGLPAGSIGDLMTSPSALLATIGVVEYATWLRYAHQTLPPQAVDQYLAYRGTPNVLVVQLLRQAVNAGIRLFSLADSMRDDVAHHGLSDLPERVYLSRDLGMAKPDPRVFDHILRRQRLQPARTLVVDRDSATVDAAKQQGMHAHTYTSEAALRAFLHQRTMLTATAPKKADSDDASVS